MTLLLAVAPYAVAGAQLSGRPTEMADTTMQRLCVHAAAAVQGKAPEAVSERHREILSVCELSDPPVLADEWGRVSGPGTALAYLVNASQYIRDERLFQAAQRAALDEGRNPAVRIAAVNVLARYAILQLGLWALEENMGPGLGFASDWTDTVTGGQPLQGDLTARLTSVLQQLSNGGGVTISRVGRQSGPIRAQDLDTTTRAIPTEPHAYAADLDIALQAYLLRRQFPVAPPKLTLDYLCGNRFRVRNKTPFALVLNYDLDTSGVMHEAVRMAPASGGGDFTEQTFETVGPGTVRLFYNGSAIVSRQNVGTPCHP